jgi:hypothetical protein
MPYYKINMRQTNVCRKTIIVEAVNESEARRAAFAADSGSGFKLDPLERRRRYIEKISLLTAEDLNGES